MPKAKKTVKKVAKRVVASEMPMPVMTEMSPPPVKKMNNKFLTSALIVLGIALLVYKVGPWAVPAVVDGRPLTRADVWSRMEQNYGAQTIDDLVNEKVLDRAIAKSGVKVEQAKVDEQMQTLESQFGEVGGLDEALSQRGMTRADLEKQVRTQVAVEMILADKVVPTEDEIKTQFDQGATTLYKDKKFDDVKASIAKEIQETKMREAFLAWFEQVKAEVKVRTFGL